MKRCCVAFVALLALAACGGGGGGGDLGGTPAPVPTPPAPIPPPNQVPVFTSPTAVSVPENTTAAYQAMAMDAEGGPLFFSISGGADAARFTITSNGALSFVTPPDFEAPADADRNNVYLVQISVSDGLNVSTLNLAVTVTDVNSATANALVGSTYVALLDLPGTANSLAFRRDGRVFLLNSNNAGDPPLFMTLSDVQAPSATTRQGVLSAALAPDFASSGTFYVALTNSAGNFEVRRYHASAATGDPSSEDVILRLPGSPSVSSLGGWIGFGPDGFLYVSTGDANGTAQDLSSLFGKILRIDVSQDAFPSDPLRDYAIPADNPYASGPVPEIYVYGVSDVREASFQSGHLTYQDQGPAGSSTVR